MDLTHTKHFFINANRDLGHANVFSSGSVQFLSFVNFAVYFLQ